MTLKDFESSLTGKAPPPSLHLALKALWWDAKGDWATAHNCAQEDEGDPLCDWVHAYLHRKEGDASNARYWYRQAGKQTPATALEAEWRAITETLLKT
jgi:hypothetical protein